MACAGPTVPSSAAAAIALLAKEFFKRAFMGKPLDW
jgi:hypothetical protein